MRVTSTSRSCTHGCVSVNTLIIPTQAEHFSAVVRIKTTLLMYCVQVQSSCRQGAVLDVFFFIRNDYHLLRGPECGIQSAAGRNNTAHVRCSQAREIRSRGTQPSWQKTTQTACCERTDKKKTKIFEPIKTDLDSVRLFAFA